MWQPDKYSRFFDMNEPMLQTRKYKKFKNEYLPTS